MFELKRIKSTYCVHKKQNNFFFSRLLSPDIVGFVNIITDKVCDAVEVAGKNVMSTTSVVTTGLVQQR